MCLKQRSPYAVDTSGSLPQREHRPCLIFSFFQRFRHSFFCSAVGMLLAFSDVWVEALLIQVIGNNGVECATVEPSQIAVQQPSKRFPDLEPLIPENVIVANP